MAHKLGSTLGKRNVLGYWLVLTDSISSLPTYFLARTVSLSLLSQRFLETSIPEGVCTLPLRQDAFGTSYLPDAVLGAGNTGSGPYPVSQGLCNVRSFSKKLHTHEHVQK